LPFVRPEAERSRGAGKDPDLYLNVVAVKTGNENSQWAKDLAAAYRSAEFKAVVDSQFAGYAKPAFLQALHRPRTAACRSDCLTPGTRHQQHRRQSLCLGRCCAAGQDALAVWRCRCLKVRKERR
jgi:hypothetical protein